ncbi:uncharacterized protein At5g39865-like [Carex rostrata]
MGSTASKQACANLQQCWLPPDSGNYFSLPCQNESVDSNASNASDSKDMISEDYFLDRRNPPLTPQIESRSLPSKLEVINSWELTEGLEDFTSINTWEIVDPSECNPQLNNENKISVSPLASNCHKTLQILGMVRARVNSFERKIAQRRMKRGSETSKCTPAEDKKVVFYFTSLTGIPTTHEDCQDAKAILQGYGVCLDERDVSMDAVFKEELNELLGTSFGGKLPRIFVDECYIGGAEEVRKLHISGELKCALEGCKMKAIGKDGNFELCPGCADVRFLPCLSCSGSCRVYLESREEGGENKFVQFERCKDCNEYGLIRCPVCW